MAETEQVEFNIPAKFWAHPKLTNKNGLGHRVSLSDLAIRIIEKMFKLDDKSMYLTPSPYDDDQPFSHRAITRAIANNRDSFEMPHFNPHYLRRTAASLMFQRF